MSEVESITLAAELQPDTAEREITRAVGARHKIARKNVMGLRKRNPEASPAEIIAMLERHYVTAITIAGGVMTAGTIAANVGIALIPGVAAGKEAGKGAAKVAAKGAAKKVAASAAAKSAVKGAAMGAAKTGAERAVQLLPAGDEQLQFEITAVFALAIAEIHGLSLDQEQAHALVYGLSNERVSQHVSESDELGPALQGQSRCRRGRRRGRPPGSLPRGRRLSGACPGARSESCSWSPPSGVSRRVSP